MLEKFAGKDKSQIKEFAITTLMGGFLVILPLAILIMVFNWLLGFILNIVSPFTGLFTKGEAGFFINLLAISILLIVCFGLGLFIRTSFGSYLYNQIEENVLAKIPFYKPIRDTIKQFSNKRDTPFSKVVLIDAFNNETRMTGFITDTHNEGIYTVFVPTGPNPTNGMIYHVKESQIEILDVSVEEALKSIISVGAGSKNVIDKKIN